MATHTARAPRRALKHTLAAVMVLAAISQVPSCSNKPTYVCEVLDDCGLLNVSVDECIDRIGLALEHGLKEDVVGHCLDCIIENPCSDIEAECPHHCEEVFEAIRAELDEMNGEAGAGGEAGATSE